LRRGDGASASPGQPGTPAARREERCRAGQTSRRGRRAADRAPRPARGGGLRSGVHRRDGGEPRQRPGDVRGAREDGERPRAPRVGAADGSRAGAPPRGGSLPSAGARDRDAGRRSLANRPSLIPTRRIFHRVVARARADGRAGGCSSAFPAPVEFPIPSASRRPSGTPSTRWWGTPRRADLPAVARARTRPWRPSGTALPCDTEAGPERPGMKHCLASPATPSFRRVGCRDFVGVLGYTESIFRAEASLARRSQLDLFGRPVESGEAGVPAVTTPDPARGRARETAQAPVQAWEPGQEVTPAELPSPRIFTVGELARCIRGTLEGEIGSVHVRGEISNLRRPTSGHLYFCLKDEGAQIRAVLFRAQARL